MNRKRSLSLKKRIIKTRDNTFTVVEHVEKWFFAILTAARCISLFLCDYENRKNTTTQGDERSHVWTIQIPKLYWARCVELSAKRVEKRRRIKMARKNYLWRHQTSRRFKEEKKRHFLTFSRADFSSFCRSWASWSERVELERFTFFLRLSGVSRNVNQVILFKTFFSFDQNSLQNLEKCIDFQRQFFISYDKCWRSQTSKLH